jgi:hypothetical protein
LEIGVIKGFYHAVIFVVGGEKLNCVVVVADVDVVVRNSSCCWNI